MGEHLWKSGPSDRAVFRLDRHVMILITSINKRRENEEKRTLKEESHSSPAGRPGRSYQERRGQSLEDRSPGLMR
jgi:hypothetical protein